MYVVHLEKKVIFDSENSKEYFYTVGIFNGSIDTVWCTDRKTMTKQDKQQCDQHNDTINFYINAKWR